MSRYKRLPVKELVVDERYQRPLDQARVERIAQNFEPALFGALDVSRRNGKAAVWDGQHRLAVAKILKLDAVPCLEHTDLTPEREAELFVEAQRARRGINQVDRFKARLFHGDEDAHAINMAVEDAGFRIGNNAHREGPAFTIRAITSLERVYRRGNLDETLRTLHDLWGGDEKSTDGGLIEGLSQILEGYGHRFDAEVIGRLQAVPPVVILRRAIGHGGGGSSKGKMVAGEIRKVAGLQGRPRSVKAEA